MILKFDISSQINHNGTKSQNNSLKQFTVHENAADFIIQGDLMLISLPKDVQSILNSLSLAGHSAYIVGGCVRDSLMKITPQDWDIATSAKPHEIKAIFPHTVDTGIAHGTVTVVFNRSNYEVTTFRIDGVYLDGRHPNDVTFTTDLEADLSRRDFTINATAYNSDTGLVDPFDGLKDIHKQNIRCVGHAPSRFTEDALRMMRAIRFSAQLSFTIDVDTYQAIAPLSERLGLVSIERIREELTKILSSSNPGALPLLEKTNLWPQILRDAPFVGDLYQTVSWLKECPKEPALLYALLLFNERNAADFMGHLKFDNLTIKETALYVQWLHKHIANQRYEVKTILNVMGVDHLKKLLILKGILEPHKREHWEAVRVTCEDIICSGECFTLRDLAVDGRELIAIGISPGKTIGSVLAALLDMVMSDPSFNQKEVLLDTACKLNKEMTVK